MLSVPILLPSDSDDHGESTGSWERQNKSNNIFPARPFLAAPHRHTIQRLHQHSTILLALRFPGPEVHWHRQTSIQNTTPANALHTRSMPMTLSSTSRQQRKSMLPKPRLSSRISARRVTSGDTTSRIARRVPSPLLAVSFNNCGTTAQALRAATDCNLSLPEAGLRRAGSPWSAGQSRTSPDSCPTPDQSETSSSLMSRTPSPEAKKNLRVDVNVQYSSPPALHDTRPNARHQHQRHSPSPALTMPRQGTPAAVVYRRSRGRNRHS